MTEPDEPAVRTARRWLADVAREVGVDPTVLDPAVNDVLDLTKAVAHGPSRPAAPLTAFLVGLSLSPNSPADDIRARLMRIRDLAATWKDADDEAH
ncbi:DUF6457 domain-containing protein [Corynebacterium uropygiale]|uniref:DUF6457 domain-containing protein n=1 Tax=Corynebacterium uropygiale TaxID=1775911 RepID=A0A9X1QMA7_9CORY|nr:DUF6457 domain-containing protein [Corynebacterium uropygiale]MCF4005922.1 DUF6457 domain-containing protein [Corynebacterium uropygiale]